jgi:amino acid transporter
MAGDGDDREGLRRTLGLLGAIGISIALIAPSMAANINPQATAQIVGRAVPLAFALSLAGVLLVAYGFVRLTQRYAHAGSVYGLVGLTLGPRAGVLAGWALLGTYVLFAVVTGTAAGIFATTFLDAIGVWNDPPQWAPFVVAPVLLVVGWVVATLPTKPVTRVLLSAEGITVALILAIALVILVKLIGGDSPNGQTFTLDVFVPPAGVSGGDVFKGAIFGFLSFAGFEAAATLAEETNAPRRNIPRAILGTALVAGGYFVLVTAIEVMGFGTGPRGIAALTGSGSLLGDLGSVYIADWIGDLVTLGTAVSAFACALASSVGASRLLFAFGRDGVGPRALGRVSERSAEPVAALAVVAAAVLTILLGLWAFATDKPLDVFSWSATIGTLILLVAYGLAAIGALRMLFAPGAPPGRRWEAVFPLGALVVIGFTYRYNIDFSATGAALWNPIVAGIWIAAGLVIVLGFPGVARRVAAALV